MAYSMHLHLFKLIKNTNKNRKNKNTIAESRIMRRINTIDAKLKLINRTKVNNVTRK